MMPVGEDRGSYLVVEEGLGWSTMLGAGAVASDSFCDWRAFLGEGRRGGSGRGSDDGFQGPSSGVFDSGWEGVGRLGRGRCRGLGRRGA